MAENTSMSFLIAFLMATVSVQAWDWRSLIQSKTRVVVVNDLPGGAKLSFRCHSTDGDRGPYTLNKGRSQEIVFYDSMWGDQTLVTCDFYWGKNQRRSFDIYNSEKDGYRCQETCRLHIEPRGPFFYTEVTIEKNTYWSKSIWLKVPLPWK